MPITPVFILTHSIKIFLASLYFWSGFGKLHPAFEDGLAEAVFWPVFNVIDWIANFLNIPYVNPKPMVHILRDRIPSLYTIFTKVGVGLEMVMGIVLLTPNYWPHFILEV